MSVLWCLENESKGPGLTFILCLLGLLVQWGCHSSAESTVTPSTYVTANYTIDNQMAAFGSNTSTANISRSGAEESGFEPTDDGKSVESPFISMDKGLTPLQSPEDQQQTGQGHENQQQTEQGQMQGESSREGTKVVFISLLVCGLLAGAAILAGSYMSSRKNRSPPSRRLDEETDARDRDSAINAVAAEDKPKVNGEAPETGENSAPASVAATVQTADAKGRLEGDTEL